MREEEWLDYPNPEKHCADPEAMLNCFRDTPSERKLRLLAFASCSLVYDRLRYSQSRKAIEVLGRYAEGMASSEDLATAAEGAWAAAGTWGSGPLFPHFEDDERTFLEESSLHEAIAWVVTGADHTRSILDNVTNALVRMNTDWESCRHIRCIFGNPFRTMSIDPRWLSSTVTALAEGIYQERAFDRMPILADALEEAGCDNKDILNHCRELDEHVRGCWVVDLLTGRK